MALDTRGILAAVTIAIYVPFLLLSLKVVVKYGTNRSLGWILLLIFCFIRVLGGALLVAAEDIEPVNTGLYIGGYALEASGLSPLLLCTLGLLHTILRTPQSEARYQVPFRIFHLIGVGGVILTITGISNSGSSSANIMRRAGVLLFVLLYAIIVIICFFIWSRVHAVLKYRKELLKAISIALPFLLVRTVYSVLSTFSSSTFSVSATTTPNDSSLARFNIVTGEWQIYLVMDMLMEYAVVVIYTIAGLMLPLDQDYKFTGYNQEEYPMSGAY